MMSVFDTPLQPLRISPGWTVEYNEFYEIDLEITTDPELWRLRNQSLLQLTHVRRNRLLDLGWYPEGEETGAFIIQLYEGDFLGRLLQKLESRSRHEIVTKLELYMAKVEAGRL